jgi:hypothetical protein
VSGAATFTGGVNLNGLVQVNGASGGTLNMFNPAGVIAQASGSNIMIQGNGGANDAFMTFHAPGAFATNLGMTAAGRFYVGGGSMGNVKYEIHTDANPQKYLPFVSPGTAYACVLGDAGRCILVTTYAVIPANVAYTPGTRITFVNWSGTTVSIIADTGVAMYYNGAPGNRSLTNTGVATAMRIEGNNWLLTGSGIV